MSQRSTVSRTLPEGGGLGPVDIPPQEEPPRLYEIKCRQWLASTSATLTMVIVGTVYGWTTTSLLHLTSGTGGVPLILTHDESSWIVSLTVFGSMIGSLMGAQFADRYGRKYCLLLCCTIFTFGWIVIYAAITVSNIYIGRVILGIGVGIAYTINPVYVSEIADNDIRGALGTLIAVNVFTGSLVTCTLGLMLTYKALLGVLVIISFISFLSNTCFPETPYFLVSKGRKKQACKSIKFYKGILDPHEMKIALRSLRPQTSRKLQLQARSDLPLQFRSGVVHSQSTSDFTSSSKNYFTSNTASGFPSSLRDLHSDAIWDVDDAEPKSDINLPSSSDSQQQPISIIHSEVICKVYPQSIGEVHPPSTSEVHRPSTSEVHRPSTSEGHPSSTSEVHSLPTSEVHPPSTSEVHPPSTSEIYRPSASEVHPPSTSEVHRLSTSEVYRPFTSEGHPSSISEVHSPFTSEVHSPFTIEVQPSSTSRVHLPSTSEVHRPSTSEAHPPSTSEVHPPSTIEVQPSSTIEVQPESIVEINLGLTSEIHLGPTSEIDPGLLSEMYTRTRTEFHSGSTVPTHRSTASREVYVEVVKQTWITKLRVILQRKTRKALFIMLGLIMAQQFSGNFITMQYLEVLFSKTTIGIQPNVATILVLAVGLISGSISTLTVEFLGRRTLLILSTLGSCITLIILATYLLLAQHKFDVSIVSTLPVIDLIIYQVMFQIGLGTIPNVLLCELFPTELKGFVGAITVIFDGIMGITVSKLYQVITDNVGSYSIYFIFATSCCLAFLLVYIWLPETKGKTYEEIEALLVGKNLNSPNEEARIDRQDNTHTL